MAACGANKYDVLIFKINKNRFIVTQIVHKPWRGRGGGGGSEISIPVLAFWGKFQKRCNIWPTDINWLK